MTAIDRGVGVDELQVRRWRRFGQDRLYVSLANGTPVGCLDLRTGRTTLDRWDLKTAFERAVADHRRCTAKHRGSASADDGSQLAAVPPAVGADADG